MPELDVVRGLAVLMVLHCHVLAEYPGEPSWPENAGGATAAFLRSAVATASPLGWLGVQLFFVLSGFLITGILLAARSQPGYYSRFYARRAVRILPAYLLCLLVLVVLGLTDWGFPSWSLGQIACCLGFAANLMPLFGLASPYGPLWSLAVEEHFYMFWPYVVRRFGGTLGWICISVAAAEVAMRWMARAADPAADLTTLTWFNLDGLVTGALAGLVVRQRGESVHRVAVVAFGFIGIAVGLFVALTSQRQLPRATFGGGVFGPSAWSLLFAGCILLAVLSRARRPSAWSRFVPFGVFRWFGFISYGLYLIHVMIMHLSDHFLGGLLYPADLATHGLRDVVVRYAVIGVSASALAFLSRTTIEEYFLRRKTSAEFMLSNWFRRGAATRRE